MVQVHLGLDLFLESIKKVHAIKTKEAYTIAMKTLLKAIGDIPVSLFTKKSNNTFLDYLKDNLKSKRKARDFKTSPNTWHNYTNHIHIILLSRQRFINLSGSEHLTQAVL
jgi:hypothetical protein